MNYLICSKKEKNDEGIKRIRQEAERQEKKCKIINVKDLSALAKLAKTDKQKDLIYFLTVERQVGVWAEFLKNPKRKIVNDRMLGTNLSKFILQQKMRQAGVSVPQSTLIGLRNISIEYGKYKKFRYPLFLKSQNHISPNYYIKNSQQLKKHLQKIKNYDEWYLEDCVNPDIFELKKIYYIKNSVIDSSGIKKLPYRLKLITRKIARSLNLEIFSADIFVSKSTKDYFCIDVNYVSTFFNSPKAISCFVKKILI